MGSFKDPLIISKFKFVEYISQNLIFFPSVAFKLIPFLFDVLNDIFNNFLKIFVLNGVMGRADTVQKILELDLLEPSY